MSTQPSRERTTCPHLGTQQGRGDTLSRPTEQHRCYAPGAVPTIPNRHQAQFCLSGEWVNCPRLLIEVAPPPTPAPPIEEEPAPTPSPLTARRQAPSGGLRDRIYRRPPTPPVTPPPPAASAPPPDPNATAPQGALPGGRPPRLIEKLEARRATQPAPAVRLPESPPALPSQPAPMAPVALDWTQGAAPSAGAAPVQLPPFLLDPPFESVPATAGATTIGGLPPQTAPAPLVPTLAEQRRLRLVVGVQVFLFLILLAFVVYLAFQPTPEVQVAFPLLEARFPASLAFAEPLSTDGSAPLDGWQRGMAPTLVPVRPRPTTTPTSSPQPQPESALPSASPTLPPPPPTMPPVTPIPFPPSPSTLAPERVWSPRIGLDTGIKPVGTREYMSGNQFVREFEVVGFAAGWHNDSALPGAVGNTVLSGHHNTQGAVFRRLIDLKPGDFIFVDAGGQTYTYVVSQNMLLPEEFAPPAVQAQNAQWVLPSADVRLTLVTCWPAYANTHRVVVVAVPYIG